jgi:hypothetical protein
MVSVNFNYPHLDTWTHRKRFREQPRVEKALLKTVRRYLTISPNSGFVLEASPLRK